MRIALAQMNPVSGDIDGNAARIVAAMQESIGRQADLLVTPEMALPGYCIGDLVENADFLTANEQALLRIAAAATGITAVVGFIDYELDARNENGTVRKYNAAAVVRDGRILQRARKSLLPNYRYFDDKRFFAPASHRDAVDIESGEGTVRVGVSICEDMWDEFYPIKPLPELVAGGASVLLNLNASPFYPGKRHERDALIRSHVVQLQRPIVYVNTVGASDNGKNVIAFDGESLVYDERGRLIAIGPQFEETLLVTDVGPGAPVQPELALPEIEREREMFDALVMGLRDYMRKTSFTHAVVPVSGGIDSALALAIAVDALGPANVTTYNLPSQFNTEVTRSIAERLTGALGVAYGIIPIGEIDRCVRGTFEGHAHPIARSLTRENLHARIRGLLMMAESNDTGALLISCGNETEIALGYATLYGDMCGGISVIGDLSKIDVYNLARYANTRFGREVIPAEAFTLKPSAELAADQFDPFDYYVMAPIVNELAERRRAPSELITLFDRRALDPARFVPDPEGRTVYDKHTPDSFRALVHEAVQRMRRSVYKRLQGPPILAISERAFGFDLRETIINGWER